MVCEKYQILAEVQRGGDQYVVRLVRFELTTFSFGG